MRYKEDRGTHEAGSMITDPRDFFDELINNSFGDVKELHDNADADTQGQIHEIFNGENIFVSLENAQLWFDEVREEESELARVKDALMPFLTQ